MLMNRTHTASNVRAALVSRIAWLGIATLVLTTVHHVYGAYAFGTIWRLHVAFISVPATAAIALARARYRRNPDGALGAVAFWIVVTLTGVVSVALFGLFEGAYNHVLKDVLYGVNAPRDLLTLLFPPPTYEPPSDLFFELSGVMHVVPASLAVVSLWRLFRGQRCAGVAKIAA